MTEERLDITQAKLISNLKKSLSTRWKITYENHLGELSINIRGPSGIFIDCLSKPIAKVTHYQNKRYLLLHFEDNTSDDRKDHVRNGLKIATKFLICEV